MDLQHTPAFKIFHYPIKVRIPQVHLYDRGFIEQFGLPTTQDKSIDKNLSKELTSASLTISQIAELLSEGAAVVIEDTEKTVMIYETIMNHLDDWQRKLRSGVSAENVPLDDLGKLNDLANKVYPLAKPYMTNNGDGTKLANKLTLAGFGSKTRVIRNESKEETNKVPTHQESKFETISKEIFRQSEG